MKKAILLFLSTLLIASFSFSQDSYYETAKYYYRQALISSQKKDYKKAIRTAQDALEEFLDSGDKAKAEEMTNIIEDSAAAMSSIDDKIKKAIANKSIADGMTKEDVIKVWGKPRDINRTVVSGKTTEQWCYGDIIQGTDRYVYFNEDEIVTSWQD